MQKLRRIADDFRNPITLAIGATTTVGYGTLYYAWAVFAPVVSAEFGIGLDTFFAIFAVGLFCGGLFAPMIGHRVDRFGARLVMTVGSCVAAAALVFLSFTPTLWSFAFGVLLMEIAAAMVLYEAAFAGLAQIYGQKARRHITSVTLIAGLASTVFWPLTQALVAEFGWRETCLVFAVLHLMICLPLHWTKLTVGQTKAAMPQQQTSTTKELVLKGAARSRALLLYALAICISGAIFAAMPVHIIMILQSEGITAQTATFVAMIVGPAQVIARLTEMALEERNTALVTGRICLAALPISFLALVLPGGAIWSALIFAGFYGVSQGLANIVRGSVPLHLFGSKGYGALVGRINGIRFALSAGSPFAFAYLASLYGMTAALWCCLVLGALSTVLFWLLRSPVPSISGEARAEGITT